MAIRNGYGMYKRYVKLNNGDYQLVSHWTSSDTVQMPSGNTLDVDLGAIRGITDSLTSTSSNVALSALAGTNLRTNIDTLGSRIDDLTPYEYTYVSPNISQLNGYEISVWKVGYVIYVCGYVNPKAPGINSSLFGDMPFPEPYHQVLFPLSSDSSMDYHGWGRIYPNENVMKFTTPVSGRNYVFNFSYIWEGVFD